MNEQQHEKARALRHFGKLRVWSEERGFGFLVCETASPKDFFIHATQVDEAQRERLAVGVFVEFTPMKQQKGWVAMRATLIE
jgi:cold shock CspA family protein